MEGWKSWGVGGWGGGWNESRASKSREGEGGGERGKGVKRERRREGWGAAEQSSRDPDRKKKQIFFLLAAGKDRLMFLYNKQGSLSKRMDREKAHSRKNGI